KPPDPVSGVRRPAQTSSSPNSKSDKASHPAAKKVRAMTFTKEVEVEDVLVEDVTYEDDLMKDPVENNKQSKAPPVPNAWTNDAAKLFDRSEEWYVADSDSEDVAESMREEDDMMDEDDDPTCPSILFTAAEKLSFRREWRSALVVKGLGRRIPYLPLARRLNFLWAKTGNIQISDLNNGYFLVRFREKEDYEAAMIGGPWMLGETYLTVHRWHKGFNPWRNEVTSTLVWVQLPDLPVEFYHTQAVMRIASKIGTPVRVDRATKEGARAKYARVCVEVDLTRPLLSKYRIEGVRYFIGYEGLKDLCTNCGKYGAPALRCTCRNPVPDEDPMMDSAVNEEQSREEETEKVYGSWMVPRSRKKRWDRRNDIQQPSHPKRQPHNAAQHPVMVSNPFFVLQETNTTLEPEENVRPPLSPSSVNNRVEAPTNLRALPPRPSLKPPGAPLTAPTTPGDSPVPKQGPVVVNGEAASVCFDTTKLTVTGRVVPQNNKEERQGAKGSHLHGKSIANGAGNQSPSVIR
ncbi:hypothetical protein LINGRAHAP2_LOCUS13565, partial [Linum grandiflorum]